MKRFDLAKSYFRVEAMIRKLHELTGGKTELPNFLRGSEYLTTIWTDMMVAIEQIDGAGALNATAEVLPMLP